MSPDMDAVKQVYKDHIARLEKHFERASTDAFDAKDVALKAEQWAKDTAKHKDRILTSLTVAREEFAREFPDERL